MHYQGDKATRNYHDLWLTAEMIDLEVDRAYQWQGVAGVHAALAQSDSLEHMLSRIGAEIALLKYGDASMYAELITSKPPGESDVLPSWAVAAARDQSKALYQQAARVRGGGKPTSGVLASDDEQTGPKQRKQRKAKAKGKAKAAAKAPGPKQD